VDDQGGDIDRGQVRPEVGGGERGDALVGAAVAAGHALQPEGVPEPLVDVVVTVVTEEGAVGQIAVEL
jgi:hypothetical protein